MLISLFRYPVTQLGPGKRIGIWTAGCSKNCPGCMSKSEHEFDPSKSVSIDLILDSIKKIKESNPVDGITISGGDPLEQKDVLELLKGIKEIGIDDVLVYTGYLFEEIKDARYIKYIDVIVDGPYVEELNENESLRGSSNQRIIIRNNLLIDKYKLHLENARREFEFDLEDGKLVVIGMLPKGGDEILRNIIGG